MKSVVGNSHAPAPFTDPSPRLGWPRLDVLRLRASKPCHAEHQRSICHGIRTSESARNHSPERPTDSPPV